MRTCKWMFTAALLVSVSAAQQPAESQPLSPAANGPLPTDSQPQNVGSVPPLRAGTRASVATQAPAATTSQPAATPSQSQSSQGQATASAPAPTPSALPQPTTMDQVVDRFIEREHGLMKALS